VTQGVDETRAGMSRILGGSPQQVEGIALGEEVTPQASAGDDRSAAPESGRGHAAATFQIPPCFRITKWLLAESEVAEEDVGIRQLAVKRGIREARVNQSDLSGGVHRKREHRTRCKVRGFRALATAQAIASDGEHNSARLRSPQLIRSCVWIVSTEALIDPYAERVRSLSSGVELKMQRTEVPRTLDPDPPAGQSNGVVAASKRAGEVVV